MHGFFVLSRICEHAYNAHSLPRLAIFSLSDGFQGHSIWQGQATQGWRALTFTNHERRHPASEPLGIFRSTTKQFFSSKLRTENLVTPS